MKISIITIALSLFTNLAVAQELKTVQYKDGSQKLNGLVTNTKARNKPGVLILPAWKGVDNEARLAALALEKHGYVAFIADIYGEGNTPKSNEEAAKSAGFFKTNYEAYQKRIKLALDELLKQGVSPKKVAVIGYCFGGTGALEVARAGYDVAGVVSIHGGLVKDSSRKNNAIKTKVLVEHPANDKSVSKEDYDNLVKELNEGGGDWQIITYANSGHTFTNPESQDYNKIMADRAWQHTLLFLDEILKTK